MAIFNSYVKLPDGIGFQPSFWWCKILQPSTVCRYIYIYIYMLHIRLMVVNLTHLRIATIVMVNNMINNVNIG